MFPSLNILSISCISFSPSKNVFIRFNLAHCMAYLMLMTFSLINLIWFWRLMAISLLNLTSFFITFVMPLVVVVRLFILSSNWVFIITYLLLFDIILFTCSSSWLKSSWSGLPVTYFHAVPIIFIALVLRLLKIEVMVRKVNYVWSISWCRVW